jgi:predicted O-linked N-acetylglucosamine transferase (SPINDLY family)
MHAAPGGSRGRHGLADEAHTRVLATAVAHHQRGQLAQAEALYRQVLETMPDQPDALHLLGVLARQQGRPEAAVALIGRALELNPRMSIAHHNLGIALLELRRPQEALACYERAVALEPGYVDALVNRGHLLRSLGRAEDALASHDRAVALDPGRADAWGHRGNALMDLERPQEALASYDRSMALNLDQAGLLSNRGVALRNLKRPHEALASCDQALLRDPHHADAHLNRGLALADLARLDEAVECFDRALALQPAHATALVARGHALRSLKRPREALDSYEKAHALEPGHADTLVALGAALLDLGRSDQALASYDRAIALQPDHAEAHQRRGNILLTLQRLAEALASYDRAAGLEPGRLQSAGDAAHTSTLLCRWADLPQRVSAIAESIGRGWPVTAPWPLLAMVDDPLLHRQAAQAWARERVGASGLLGPLRAQPRGPRIHVAYLSADFHDHATTRLVAELLELHDRQRFELTGISFGPDTRDTMRARVSAAFDRFIDVRERSDVDVARLCRELGVDIAVDLKGYTQDSRPGILAERCAPIQVNWLGYPGTMGVPFIDYIVADPVLVTEADLGHYSEKVIWLPHSYQPNDRKRPIAQQVSSRADHGLPVEGFVYCCFNAAYKIQPEVFDTWMKVLQRVPGSVLWLLQANPEASANLRREAAARGVDPGRLVFAPKLPLAEHLARHRLADLCVDTWPCNAHTTASDALWAGLPVLTRRGRSFAGRVAASLLHAIGLPELVTHSREEYEELAVSLAGEPGRLGALRSRLHAHRDTWPLFDCTRFTRHLEAAYEQAARLAGQPAQHIRIEEPAPKAAPTAAPRPGKGSDTLLQAALADHQRGQLAQAEVLYRQVLEAEPDQPDALHMLGVLARQQGRAHEAVTLIGRALELRPDMAMAHNNLGNALLTLGRPREALASYDRAVALRPDYADAYGNRGNAMRDLGRLEEALASLDRALALDPGRANAHTNRGNLLLDLGRPEEALDSHEQAVRLQPADADAHYNRGNALLALQRPLDAIASYDRAVALQPGHAAACSNRGNALLAARRPHDALASYERALELKPGDADLLCNRALALRDLGRLEEALASYDRALALKPDCALAAGHAAHVSSLLCRWEGLAQRVSTIAEGMEKRQPVATPFGCMSLIDDPRLHLALAETWARSRVKASGLLGALPSRRRGPRIHVAYLSADFRQHAVSAKIAELLERHDRSAFEVTGISFGPDTADAMRRRLETAFDRFVDVRDRSDLGVARLCRELGVDIAVDLMGYTQDSRPGILAERCAPVQVNWLGFPGTLGAPFVDYIVADRVLISEADVEHYSERVIWLPHSYQPNDSRCEISPRTPSRADCGLPSQGFVYGCFNNAWKVQPEVFDTWMKVLQRVPGSVLWLVEHSPAAADNLRREASARGVDTRRLVFAARVPLPENLARQRLADLFVDTWPYNAHATASDALWAGLPVLTRRGRSFAGRVAASLLHAIGLPELVTHSREEYEELAVALAGEPGRLGALRARLHAHRSTWPLFDCTRFTRHLEAAYEQAIRLAGQPAQHIRIEDAAGPAHPASG